jgi:hypothetical protein
MKKTAAFLMVGAVVAILGVMPARSQSGEGDATAAPSPATADAPPPAAAPAESPAAERELTAVLVSSSADSIVLRKWDSTEISFRVPPRACCRRIFAQATS